jgi:lipoprotein NlpI
VYRILVVFVIGCGTAADDPKPGKRSDFDRAKAAADAKPNDPAAQFRFGEAALAGRKNEVAEQAYSACLVLDPKDAAAWDRRGDARLKLGKFKDAVEDFDAFLNLKPEAGPYHWRRGIALYYAGKYAEGAKQFASHKAVNAEDVENAAWHFLCVARDKGVEEARKGLIVVTRDVRVPMAQVQKLFAGTGTVDDVFAAAAKEKEGTDEGRAARFYAHLYVGLFYEATGDAKRAKEHVQTAAEKYEIGHYMWDVAAAQAKTFK